MIMRRQAKQSEASDAVRRETQGSVSASSNVAPGTPPNGTSIDGGGTNTTPAKKPNYKADNALNSREIDGCASFIIPNWARELGIKGGGSAGSTVQKPDDTTDRGQAYFFVCTNLSGQGTFEVQLTNRASIPTARYYGIGIRTTRPTNYTADSFATNSLFVGASSERILYTTFSASGKGPGSLTNIAWKGDSVFLSVENTDKEFRSAIRTIKEETSKKDYLATNTVTTSGPKEFYVGFFVFPWVPGNLTNDGNEQVGKGTGQGGKQALKK